MTNQANQKRHAIAAPIRQILLMVLTLVCSSAFAETAHENESAGAPEHAEHGTSNDQEENPSEHQEGSVVLSVDQLNMAGIVVDYVKIQPLSRQLYAPAEVINNQYSTTQIAPKITSQVIKRHVVLGQEVLEGQSLITLYSVELAKAQAELLVAHNEWRRVEKLGQKTVGAKRYTESKVVFDQLLNQVGAYGITREEAQRFLSGHQNYHQLGEFDLTAPHQGVVLSDEFSEGQSVEAGTTLIRLVDESTVWVEASLAPDIGIELTTDTSATVEIQGMVFEGHVTQQAHLISEATRTWKVRILVNNPNHILHAGLFAEVVFTLPVQREGIVVPDSALMRSSDGDWTVFVEEAPGRFKQTEIEIIGSSLGLKVIEGIPSNTRIVVAGAFFVASELAKSGFDIHDH